MVNAWCLQRKFLLFKMGLLQTFLNTENHSTVGILGTKQGCEKQTLERYVVIQVLLKSQQTGPQVRVQAHSDVRVRERSCLFLSQNISSEFAKDRQDEFQPHFSTRVRCVFSLLFPTLGTEGGYAARVPRRLPGTQQALSKCASPSANIHLALILCQALFIQLRVKHIKTLVLMMLTSQWEQHSIQEERK